MNLTTGAFNTGHVKMFEVLDYCVFGIMLGASAVIGIYFGFFAKQKQNTRDEYLMGGKQMSIFPISFSLIASYISGISLLGLPSEMYVFGTQFWISIFAEAAFGILVAFAYLPIFYTLQITSTYEYLNMRFNHKVRLMGSLIFLVQMLLYIPIVIYVPALAFSQVTGINLHLITPVVCIICIFYTSLGGLKAVVWTDTLQAFLMLGGVIIVMVLGTVNIGGPKVVFEKAAESGRLEFLNFNMDPTIRHTFWSVFIGNGFGWLSACAVSQAMVQRCLALPDIHKAKILVLILGLAIGGIVSMCCYTGLVIYATYADCDPVLSKAINKPDQILPFFVMQLSDKVPGLPGLFVCGVFSAALSSLSTGLNSMTGIIYQDLIYPLSKKPASEAKASFIMKVVVVIVGAICVALVFVVEKLGTLIQAGRSLAGPTAGSLLGTFTLGMFFPWANSQGAFAAGIVSLVFTGWISLGAQAAIARGQITFPRRPVSVEGCSLFVNSSFVSPVTEAIMEEPFILYKLSYLWYTFISFVVAMLVGIIVSYVTGFSDPKDLDRRLFSPVIHRFLPDTMKDLSKEEMLAKEELLAKHKLSIEMQSVKSMKSEHKS